MSTLAYAPSPEATPAPANAYRQFTTSRWGALVHVIVGGAAGVGLTLGLILGLIASLFSGMYVFLILIPVVPFVAFWAIDALLFRWRGSLGRGALAALTTIIGVTILFVLARDSGDDGPELFIGGPIVGMIAVFVSRITSLFGSDTASTPVAPPAAN
jgi:hypothetical protein